MRRAHRRVHVLMWLVIIPVTLSMFVLSLYLKQPDPENSATVLNELQQGAN